MGRRPGPAPGWYPNPGSRTGVRYWDGSRWGAELHQPGSAGTSGSSSGPQEAPPGGGSPADGWPAGGASPDGWPASGRRSPESRFGDMGRSRPDLGAGVGSIWATTSDAEQLAPLTGRSAPTRTTTPGAPRDLPPLPIRAVLLPVLAIMAGVLLFAGFGVGGFVTTSSVAADGVSAPCGSIVRPQDGSGLHDRLGDCSDHRVDTLVGSLVLVLAGALLIAAGGLWIRHLRKKAARAMALGPPEGAPVDPSFGFRPGTRRGRPPPRHR